MSSLESLAELVRVAPDAYLVRHQNHVALCIVAGEAGVVLIDPIGLLDPRVPELIRSAIGVVTEQPVRYVVYSHSSADHSTGAAIFADTAQFVGHRLTADRMAAAASTGVNVTCSSGARSRRRIPASSSTTRTRGDPSAARPRACGCRELAANGTD
jgi:glyoxylase-like metal-dependent hydrolase (beta-lactamase superfamily II)